MEYYLSNIYNEEMMFTTETTTQIYHLHMKTVDGGIATPNLRYLSSLQLKTPTSHYK